MLIAELKSLWHNKLLILIVVAIIMIPSIYAGFFLSSMWDPYGDLEYLPVAVVNNDKSVTYNGKELTIGKTLADNLATNDSMAFNIVDEDVAMKGLKNGTYYMVITIPENFSENATTLMDDDPQEMTLQYTTNPGNNYISMKLSESAMKTIQANITEEVTRTYAENVFDSLEDVKDGFQEATDGTQDMLDGEDQLVDGNDLITENLELLADGTDTLKSGTSTLSSGANTLNNSMSQLTSGASSLASGVNTYTSGVGQLSTGISTLKKGTVQLVYNVPALTAGVQQLKDGSDQLTAGYEGENGANAGASTLADGMSEVNSAVQDITLPSANLTDAQKTQIATAAAQSVAAQADDITSKAQAGVAEKESDIKTAATNTAKTQVANTSDADKATLIAAGQTSANTAYSSVATLQGGVKALVESTASAVITGLNANLTNNSYYTTSQSALDNANTSLEDVNTELGAANTALANASAAIENAKTAADPDLYLASAAEYLNTAKTNVSSAKTNADSAKGNVSTTKTNVTYMHDATVGTTASAVASGVATTVEGKDDYKAIVKGISTLAGGSFASGYGSGTVANAGTIAYNAVLQAAGTIAQSAASTAAQQGAVLGAQGVASEVNTQLGTFGSKLDILKAATSQLDTGATALKNGINQLYAGTKQLNDGLTTLNDKTGTLADGVTQLDNGATQLEEGANKLTANSDALSSGATSVSDGTKKVASAVSQIADGSKELDDGASELADGASQLYDGSKELGDGLDELQSGTVTLHDALADGEEQVAENSADDDTLDMFSSPVTIEENKMTEVENNGHGMAAYMMSVGLWVGCLAFCLMYPLTKYHGDFKSGFQWWFSKAAIAAPAGLLMVVTLLLVMTAFLGFDPGSMFKTFVVATFAVMAFMCIQYFFDILFGRVGSFLMLIFMVLQLTGSAGTYPIEISGGVAKALHAWMPFTYSVNGFRAAIASGDTQSITSELVVLGGISLVFTILTIIVFQIRGNCIRKGKTMLYDWIEEKGLA